MAYWSLFVQYPNREPVLRELVAPQSLSELRDALEVFDDQHLLVGGPQLGQFTPVERVSQLYDGVSLRVAVPRRRIFVSRQDGLVRGRPVVWYPGAGAEQIEAAIVKACGFPVGTAIELLDQDVAVVISATIPNDSALTAVPLLPEGGSVGARAAPGAPQPNGTSRHDQHDPVPSRRGGPPESPRRPGPGVRAAVTPPVPRAASVRTGAGPRGNSAGAPPGGGGGGPSAGGGGAGQHRARSATPQHHGGGSAASSHASRPATASRAGSPSRVSGGGGQGAGGGGGGQQTPGGPPPAAQAPAGAGGGGGEEAPASDEHCVHILAGHAGPVLSLCSVGDVLFTGSQDCNIMIWDLNNLQYIGTLPGHSGPVKCMAATLARKMLCSGSQDKTIKVWSLDTFSCQKTFLGHTSEVNAMAILERPSVPDVLLSGGEDRSIRVWDLAALSLLANLEQAHLSGVFALSQLDAGAFLSASRDRTVKVWVTSSWQARRTLGPPHYDGVSDLAVGTRSGTFFSASRDRSIRRWDAQSLESTLQLTNAHGDWLTALAISPSETTLFSGGRDSAVKVWDRELCCKHTLTGHRGPVTALLTVERHLFSASHDRTVRVWQVDKFDKM